jgi:hypothetical protein
MSHQGNARRPKRGAKKKSDMVRRPHIGRGDKWGANEEAYSAMEHRIRRPRSSVYHIGDDDSVLMQSWMPGNSTIRTMTTNGTDVNYRFASS